MVAVYREKISGTTEWEKRPELARLIGDLQQNDVVIAESIDRLTRLEPKKALELIDAIQSKGAKIQVPEVFDMNTLSQSIGGQASVFDPHFLMSDLFSALQNMFFKLAVSVAYNDYQKRKERQHQGIALARKQRKYRGRQPNIELHNAIIEQRKNGTTIKKTAAILNTSESTVLRVWRKYKT
ncbi:DNA invertase Pin-like site-specific DNA recombinase [Nicoletella semolina]|uniref:DNA invertase Pin-like site-specific DNA recombinase n=1 Tax=Nicoletella semolina TaxID=271160 RepID=A0A4R2NBB7_9PAST|nr:DNA invertase Pin-like site-specific DNA recombinase [Nicoletella semolina]